MENHKKKISIISVNYNQSAVTNQMLKSLSKLSWENVEIIIVDNGSFNEDYKKIDSFYDNVKIIYSAKNTGFAGGNNMGIKASTGDYILLLNNDTEVDSGFIEPMLQLFELNPQIGAISPKIKYFDHPEIIQYAGFSKINPFTLRMNAIGHKQKDSSAFNHANPTNFIHGCAVMVPREVIDRVGMMKEDYFLYYEEHDWSMAIKRAGYILYYQPGSVVYHKESVSVKKNSPLKIYFINRNRILFMRKNFNALIRLIATLYLLMVSIPRNILLFSVKKNHEYLRAYLDAILWNINHKTKPKWNL